MRFLYVATVIILFGCATNSVHPPESRPVDDFGLPSLAAGEHVVRHAGFAVSFDKGKHVARWVAYHLTKQKVTTKLVARSNNFHLDPAAEGCADPDDYTKSGYDRGHLADAEDMRWSAEAMDDSFFMSNMTPQTPGLNRGIWKRLEGQVRVWATQYEDVFVVTGPVLSEPCVTKIGHDICVSQNHFKVILEKTGTQIKTIGFIIPQDGRGDLAPYARSVAAIQAATGLEFFPDLPADVARQVESTANVSEWLGQRGLAGH